MTDEWKLYFIWFNAVHELNRFYNSNQLSSLNTGMFIHSSAVLALNSKGCMFQAWSVIY